MRLVSYLIMSLTTELCLTAEELQRVIEESGMVDSRSIDFYQELLDYGIESLEQFEDSYQGQYQTGADFAEQTCEDCGYLSECNLPIWIQNHIDWETVWTNELRFDFFAIKVGVQGYEFFSSNF